MYLFLLFNFALTDSVSSLGFNTFLVSRSNPFKANLKDNDLFLIFDEPPTSYVHFTETNKFNQTTTVLASELLAAKFSNVTLDVTIESKEQYNLNYWVIPKNFCSEFSYALRVDSSMEYEISTKNTNICFFSQVNVENSDLTVRYKPKNNVVTIFNHANQKDQFNCKQNGYCQIKTSKPFFIHLRSIKDKLYKMRINYIAEKRDKNKLIKCGAFLIPSAFNGIPMFPNDIKKYALECISSDEETLINTALIGSIIFILLIALIILNLSGTIDIFVLLGFRKKDNVVEIKEETDFLNSNQEEEDSIYFGKIENKQ